MDTARTHCNTLKRQGIGLLSWEYVSQRLGIRVRAYESYYEVMPTQKGMFFAGAEVCK
jgi:hypothetical protein